MLSASISAVSHMNPSLVNAIDTGSLYIFCEDMGSLLAKSRLWYVELPRVAAERLLTLDLGRHHSLADMDVAGSLLRVA